MPIRLRRGVGGGSAPPAEAIATRNILNGVLNCKWDKTSAVPSLLEIANTSEVKFNIDADNPLTVLFADGWDDKDRPASIVKTLATAPANIDLSAKANCHVQICAKVVNDELVITTQDVYDPLWATWVNIIPSFTNNSAKDGWSISCSAPEASGYENYKAVDGNNGTYRMASGMYSTQNFYITSPFATILSSWGIVSAEPGMRYTLAAKDLDLGTWGNIDSAYTPGSAGTFSRPCTAFPLAREFRLELYKSSTYGIIYGINFYELPVVRFYRSLNQVKDREANIVQEINLGYATMDANGAITALTHYTDLRNNYPGGMRVEA